VLLRSAEVNPVSKIWFDLGGFPFSSFFLPCTGTLGPGPVDLKVLTWHHLEKKKKGRGGLQDDNKGRVEGWLSRP